MLKVLAFMMLFVASVAEGSTVPKYMRGLRLDPSYLYEIPGYGSLPIQEFADRVVGEIQSGGFNTLFLYAYNSYYGAFYPTTYPLTAVEPGLGKAKIFPLLAAAAKARGMDVIAVLPVNDFRHAWKAQSAWRVKKRDGKDYRPNTETHFLSPGHSAFASWYAGFVRDFLARNPGVNGIEAVEPGFDLNWDGAPDYNPEVVKAFQAKQPGQATKGITWNRFRSTLLTAHLGLFSRLAHEAGKEAYLVQTYTARPDGSLMTAEEIRQGLGFDWNEVLNLPAAARVDGIMAELMFQEGKATHGTAAFTPGWTTRVAQEFVRFVNGRARALIHVEYSAFQGPHGSFSATEEEVQAALTGLVTFAQGEDTYAYQLWRKAVGRAGVPTGKWHGLRSLDKFYLGKKGGPLSGGEG